MFAVVALFTTEDSVYKKLGIDAWDIERNALKYKGNSPAICHPPCRTWGKFSWRAKPRKGEKELALYAIDYVRKNGGIVEHPQSSSLWRVIGVQHGVVDKWGGFIITLDQCVFGHRARKATTLYICGCSPEDLPRIPKETKPPTHAIDNSRSTIKLPEISKKERMETPPRFAKWLIKVALKCKKK
jgi:hypothetical protein